MPDAQYEDFVRARITQLRIRKDVSEHKMSLELGKSGSYIRNITSGTALPSLKELFNIMEYFDMTPAEFFGPASNPETPYYSLCDRLKALPEDDLEKVNTLLTWLGK